MIVLACCTAGREGYTMVIDQLYVPGMRDMHHAHTITEALRQVKGVWQVQANPASGSVRVEHDTNIRVSTLIAALRRAGYPDVSVLV
jgi:copper chaperone CopZ